MANTQDSSSLSNLDDLVIKNANIDWSIDFSAKTISGAATLTFQVLKPNVQTITLDIRGQRIFSVSSGLQKLRFEIGTKLEGLSQLGETLNIDVSSLNLKAEQAVEVKIAYETSPEATAVQWLEPEQTAGKKFPYVYTQCQAIHARSLIPCQDSPSVKFTYDASVTVQAPLRVLMSACRQDEGTTNGSNMVYRFHQPKSIPSYLLALAAGNLKSSPIGPRSLIWSEPETLQAGAEEFVDTEKFISAAESLVGEYEWKTYDLLLLPPSFPYGGMENPQLTFVTPTLLDGKKSNVSVVAHEIAHSWTGNLVTTSNWAHFWLNEGFTVFLERKILRKIYGEDFMQFDALLGLNDLNEAIASMEKRGDPYTNLVPNIGTNDPDDAFSTIPYEKGFNLLYYLQKLVGGDAVFEPFFKSWIQNHKTKSVSTKDFIEYFTAAFPDTKVDWPSWTDKQGKLLVDNAFDRSIQDVAVQTATAWKQGTAVPDLSSYSELMRGLIVIAMLDELVADKVEFSVEKLEALDKHYALTADQNTEVVFRWTKLGLQSNWAPSAELARALLLRQGRMKFTRPTFRALLESKVGGPKLARAILKETNYHSICHKMVCHDIDQYCATHPE